MKYSFWVLVALASLLGSCGKHYALQPGDRSYVPYQGDEILVFESDQGKSDTIFLNGLTRSSGSMDHMALFPDYSESMHLMCTRSDPNYDRYLDGHILVRLGAGRNGATYINFDIKLKGAWFYGMTSMSLSEFDALPDTELAIGEQVYADVKIFDSDGDAVRYAHRDNYAERFYWSKSEGFLGLDQKGEKWRLVKKYVP